MATNTPYQEFGNPLATYVHVPSGRIVDANERNMTLYFATMFWKLGIVELQEAVKLVTQYEQIFV